jgi:hypothetical protein
MDATWKGICSDVTNGHYNWPIQPRPPTAFWDTWQKALRSMCGRNQSLPRKLGRWTTTWYCPRMESLFRRTRAETVTFPLRSTRNTCNSNLRFRSSPTTPSLIPPTARPCCISTQGRDLLLQGYTNKLPAPSPRVTTLIFTEYLASLEDKEWIFSSIQIRGSLTVLADAIHKGTCSCVTDGLYKDGHSTAAWKLLDLVTPEHSIKGQCITPGTLAQQNLYRSKVSGLYASVAITNVLVKFFHITSGSMTLACNNLGAIRMTSYKLDHMSPTGAHFDLIMATQYAKSPKIQWIHKHVMGHQDDVKEHIMSPLELINVDMDTKAKAYWAATHHIEEQNRKHYFSEEPWSISLDGESGNRLRHNAPGVVSETAYSQEMA